MAQTSTHYVATLARQARRLGLDIDTLLAEAGISPELSEAGDQWIDNDYLTTRLKILWRETRDETIGIDPGAMRMGRGHFLPENQGWGPVRPDCGTTGQARRGYF